MSTSSRHPKANIIYISGGQRSGKSEYAESLALRQDPHPLYIATSRPPADDDPDFQARVRRHRERRGEAWFTYEEPVMLSRVPVEGHVALIDCVTLWATNAYMEAQGDCSRALELMTAEFDKIASRPCTLIFVSNEIGMGGVSPNEMQRRFTDLQGDINRFIAARAHAAFIVVSGLPLRLK